jgi:hypothetical protein
MCEHTLHNEPWGVAHTKVQGASFTPSTNGCTTTATYRPTWWQSASQVGWHTLTLPVTTTERGIVTNKLSHCERSRALFTDKTDKTGSRSVAG